MTDGFSRLARSIRGEWTENTHFGVAAVATPEGDLVAHVGNPSKRAFLRSAAKPIQLLPLLMAGGVEEFGLSDRELTIMCSSHGGTDAHIRVARALLERSALSEQDLGCGVHVPLDREASAALRDRGEKPGPLHNNCSANHIGQLLTSRLLGWPLESYRNVGHPLQQRVLGLVAQFAGLAAGEIQIAVDGCGLPTFRMPMRNAARLYARLAHPEAGGLPAEISAPVRVIVEAMAAHPEMVSGPGRFTTELTRATGGRILGKEGAEGFYGVVVRGPVALGVALKIADGDEGCRDSVVIELLRQAGCLSSAEFERLGTFYGPELRNHSGQATGEILADFELSEVEPEQLVGRLTTPAETRFKETAG